MKQVLTIFIALFCALSLSASSASSSETGSLAGLSANTTLTSGMSQSQMDEFLTMTPKKYREMTGKKLGLKKSIELKLAQKMVKKAVKKSAGDIPQGLYIVLAIFGLAWIAMGVMDNWEGTNWWVNLLLSLLFILPGLIHALVVMGNYY